jgi:uncharacterized integral membrane protein
VRPSHGEPEGSGGARRSVSPRTIGVVALLALFIAWCAVNSQQVEINFLVVDACLRLFVALMFAGLIGAGIGYLSGSHRAKG